MIKLPKKAIDEFKEIYKRVMKVDLTDEEAAFYASEMMGLMLLAQPLHPSKIMNILKEENTSSTSTSIRNRTDKTSFYKDIFLESEKKKKKRKKLGKLSN